MSLNAINAFKYVVKLQGRPMTLERYGVLASISLPKVAPSNYTRDLAALAQTSITGREFILLYDDIKDTNYDPPLEGDILTDSILGENTITFVKELIILGQLAGYRLRTS